MKKIKYKPFDLEKAKQGAKVMTRDGHSVRIICTDKYADDYSIVALYEDMGAEFIFEYNLDGRRDSSRESDSDLVMCVEKHEGWANVYRVNMCTLIGNVYNTEEEAKKSGGCIVATIKVEWEE